MSAPQNIIDLVSRFQDNIAEYRSKEYKETPLRVEFINPFFEELGWDIENKQGNTISNLEVAHEDRIEVEGRYKAPDYSFRIGRQRKFFVETKKPFENILSSYQHAFQLKRYAWSANLPISILTDFEEFAIYDCRNKPSEDDNPAIGRKYYTYLDYNNKWDEIYSLFSRDAVLGGSLDRIVDQFEEISGIPVDKAFLNEIELWRSMLACNIAINNAGLNDRDINHAVQMTIDRIIFLRICEDREIEPKKQLELLIQEKNVYSQLGILFGRADQKYNSGLFHFGQEKERYDPDNYTLNLTISDEVLRSIIRTLCYPYPYLFSVVPADILGQVYEQFLSKEIQRSPNDEVSIVNKPYRRKEGGIYYTPTNIVNYIVSNTFTRLLQGKTPKQVDSLRIVDPACGSGSFLINSYQYLLDWHIDYYVNNNPQRYKKVLLRTGTNSWALSIEERKRILLNNIYGVDIDTQAVEVTKLSLLLKVLEGEVSQQLGLQMELLQERALPDIDRNIRCGNSLIGQDFYTMNLGLFRDTDISFRIKPFDWNENFKEVFGRKNSGFDAVIGNPPWISLSGKFKNEICTPEELNYLISSYAGNTYMPNMYEYFISKGLRLTNDGGYFSFIVPDRFGSYDQFISLRKTVLRETKIVSLSYRAPFPGIIADTLIFLLTKSQDNITHSIEICDWGKQPMFVLQEDIVNNDGSRFENFENEQDKEIVTKIISSGLSTPLSNYCDITSGFGGKSKLITKGKQSPRQTRVYKGENIGRYRTNGTFWFEFIKENITGRTTDIKKLGAVPKILLRKTGGSIIATYDGTGIYPEQSLYFLFNIHTDLEYKYILGILNSKFGSFYYRTKLLTNKESIAQVKTNDLGLFPIRRVNFSDPGQKQLHDQLVELVDEILTLNRQMDHIRAENDRQIIKHQIDAIDGEIDRLVFDLYDLTDDEIKYITSRNV